MTTRLKLLCHGSMSSVRASAFPSDEPLDTQGLRKLAALSDRGLQADRYLTSPALRAVETAAALKLDAAIEPMLKDCDYGRWSGRSLDEVQAQEPDAIARWLQDPDAAPHGGESLLAVMARVSAWLDALKATPGVILAVTHASVIRAAILHAIEAGPRSFWRIDIAPLSLTRLNGASDRWTLVSIGALRAEPGDS
jgi:broad specificity phosphatase PhoE